MCIRDSSNSRTNDLSRPIGEDPLPGTGVIAEIITTSGSLTQLITPAIIGFNNDDPVTSNVYLKVTNNSTITQAINVTLSLIRLEN